MRYDDQMGCHIGPHYLEQEKDCLLLRLHGDFTLAHMQQFCRLTDLVVAEYGGAYTISDVSHGGGIPADARRYAMDWPNAQRIQGTAIFGASLITGVFISMMTRTARFVQKHVIPTNVVKTEAEARAWIDSLRRQPYAPPRK